MLALKRKNPFKLNCWQAHHQYIISLLYCVDLILPPPLGIKRTAYIVSHNQY